MHGHGPSIDVFAFSTRTSQNKEKSKRRLRRLSPEANRVFLL
jgi:hypothetical protein